MKKNLKVDYNGNELEGILIKETDDNITLKLKSGYNAVLNKNNLKILDEKNIEIKKKSNVIVDKVKSSKLPNISILHTGGTIASKVDYETGAVSSKFTVEELLGLYPELNELANLSPKMISNLSSEDMRLDHYNLLLDAIKAEIESGSEGIIISHGTDTMHYSASALQYAIQNLPIPILLVGAQRSSDRASSDAFSNLRAAINFISNNQNLDKRFLRVGICMHSEIDKDRFAILDSINVKKMHSSRRDAFKQINYEPFALMQDDGQLILRSDLLSEVPSGKLSITKYDTSLKIGFFKAHPHLYPEEIKALEIYDIVIIEGTGLGHLAVSEFDELTKVNKENLVAISELIKTTKLVVGVQTVYGQTNMKIYSSGRYLLKTGVLGQYMNLTTETLFTRSAYLWSLDKDKFEINWDKNLEGFEIRSEEISEE